MKDIFQMPDLPTTVIRQDAQSAEAMLPPLQGRSVITCTGQAQVGENTVDVYTQRYSNTLEELTYLASSLKARLPRERAIIKARTEASRRQRIELEERISTAEAGIEENMQILRTEQAEIKQILNTMLNPSDGSDGCLKIILHTLNNRKGCMDALRTTLDNAPK